VEFPHKDGTLQCHISVSRTLFNEKRRLASTYVGLNNLQQIKPIILHTLLPERIWLQLYHWLTYLLPSDFRVKSEIIIVNMVSCQPKKHMFKLVSSKTLFLELTSMLIKCVVHFIHIDQILTF
jgi:hypothetical protein